MSTPRVMNLPITTTYHIEAMPSIGQRRYQTLCSISDRFFDEERSDHGKKRNLGKPLQMLGYGVG